MADRGRREGHRLGNYHLIHLLGQGNAEHPAEAGFISDRLNVWSSNLPVQVTPLVGREQEPCWVEQPEL